MADDPLSQQPARGATPPPQEPHPAGAAVGRGIILCGLGNLGYRIYTQLEVMGVPVVVVDPQPDATFLHRLAGGDDCLLRADARLPGVLERAGIAGAAALITTFDDDLINLDVLLTAIRLRPDLRIVLRFFNIDLAAGIQAALPHVTVLSLSALAAPAFVAAATDTYAANAIVVDDEVLSLATVPVGAVGSLEWLTFSTVLPVAWQRPPAAPLLFPPPAQPVTAGDWVTLIGREADVRGFTGSQSAPHGAAPPALPRRSLRTRVGAVLRRLDRALYVTLAVLAGIIAFSAGVLALGRAMSPLDALLLVFGVVSTTAIGWSAQDSDSAWVKLFLIALTIAGTAALTVIYAFVTNYIVSVKLRGLLGQQPVTLRNHIVICGLGTVGYRVLTGLVARGEAVAVLDRNEANRFLPLVRPMRAVQAVVGDAQLRESLELVNIAAARCIVVTTSDDIANIQTALNARQLHPRIRVVLRMFDHTTAQQVGDIFDLDVALSASALAAPAFVAAATGEAVVHEFAIADEPLVVARIVVPPAPPADPTLGHLLHELRAAVLSYHSPGRPARYRPRPGVQLTAGDTLTVIASLPTLRELTRRLAEATARTG